MRPYLRTPPSPLAPLIYVAVSNGGIIGRRTSCLCMRCYKESASSNLHWVKCGISIVRLVNNHNDLLKVSLQHEHVNTWIFIPLRFFGAWVCTLSVWGLSPWLLARSFLLALYAGVHQSIARYQTTKTLHCKWKQLYFSGRAEKDENA